VGAAGEGGAAAAGPGEAGGAARGEAGIVDVAGRAQRLARLRPGVAADALPREPLLELVLGERATRERARCRCERRVVRRFWGNGPRRRGAMDVPMQGRRARSYAGIRAQPRTQPGGVQCAAAAKRSFPQTRLT